MAITITTLPTSKVVSSHQSIHSRDREGPYLGTYSQSPQCCNIHNDARLPEYCQQPPAPTLGLSNSKHAFAQCGIPSARNPFQLATSQSSQSCFPCHREMLHQVQPHKYQSSYLQLQSWILSEDYAHSCSLYISTWSSKDPSRYLSGFRISHCCPGLAQYTRPRHCTHDHRPAPISNPVLAQ